MKRRSLDLRTAEEVIAEVQQLRARGYERCGKWNLTQVCQHLSATMVGGMNGFGFRIPWVLRATVAKWAFRYALKTRRLGSGFPTFKSLRPEDVSPSEEHDEVIDAFLETCRRAESFSGPIENYPLLDDISVDDWRQFMWIHASHHLGFLIPQDAAA